MFKFLNKKRNTRKVYYKTEKGDSYWLLAANAGTPLYKVMRFKENTWEAKKLPVGVYVRVK